MEGSSASGGYTFGDNMRLLGSRRVVGWVLVLFVVCLAVGIVLPRPLKSLAFGLGALGVATLITREQHRRDSSSAEE